MAIENVGPGGVSNSYGARTPKERNLYSVDEAYDDVHIQKDGIPVVAKTNPLTGLVNATTSAVAKDAIGAISLASSRRVDIVMIGDSNQMYNGYGFYAAFEKIFGTRFGAYATGIRSAKDVAGGYVTGGTDNSALANGGGVSTGFCAGVYDAVSGLNLSHGYAAAGALGNGASGVSAQHSAAFPISDKLRAWGALVTSTEYTGGAINACGVRLQYSPYNTVVNIPVGSVATEDQIRYVSGDISADPARTGSGLEFRWQQPGGAASTGPAQMLFARIERPEYLRGVSVHTLGAYSGEPAWRMAKTFQLASDATLTTYFSEVRRLQISIGQSPVVVIYINEGLNDRNNTRTPSLGPMRIAGTGSSAAEYVDNILAIKLRIIEIWRKNGWNECELYWLIVPSHRISDPDDTKLVSYRAAAASYLGTDPRTSVVDLGAMMTYADANAAGWYAAGQAQIHLANAGYDGIAQLISSIVP